MKKYVIIIISLSIVALALTGTAVAMFVMRSDPKEQTPDEMIPATADQAQTELTEPSSVAESYADAPSEETDSTQNDTQAQESTEEQTEAQVTAPEAMTSALAMNGMDPSTLSAYGCSQLVTVSSYGSSAQIDFYSLENNEWTADESLSCSGFVGSNGVTTDMHEGGHASPFGLYSISQAFYIYDAPQTGLPAFEITSDTYWVDDPDSKYYNRHVEGTDDKDWDSAEHMIDFATSYEYGFVIDYNTAAEYNKGSAIFFHISSNSTAGCVGTDRSHVLAYLAKLDASKNPYILIV